MQKSKPYRTLALVRNMSYAAFSLLLLGAVEKAGAQPTPTPQGVCSCYQVGEGLAWQYCTDDPVCTTNSGGICASNVPMTASWQSCNEGCSQSTNEYGQTFAACNKK